MVTLIVYFTNGSSSRHEFASYTLARLYARDNISYSGGRIDKVCLGNETLWSRKWNAVSQHAGLWDMFEEGAN